MRGPAKAAGLAELQRFLESGFDTFKAMGGAREFLSNIGTRERGLARALFEAQLQADGRLGDTALGQLP
jgi:ABC-type protease/lipase transport system fused ATPase/permease subunit